MIGGSPGEFLTRFFGSPNTAWPHASPSHAAAANVAPFLEALSSRGEAPLILPRRETGWPAAAYYVICWDTAHAGRVRALLEASVAHHWVPFDGRVATLRGEDPVESAVLDLVGPATTFVVRPLPATSRPTFEALSRLVRLLIGTPLRKPTLARPVGRMLLEFELALESGEVEQSARLLQEIETLGGISNENVGFLHIRRLARLGQNDRLLSHGSLPTLVYAEPPLLVREAVLGAWAQTKLERPITADRVEQAIERVRCADPDVAILVDERLAASGDSDVATLCALVAIARADVTLQSLLATNNSVDPDVAGVLVSETASSTDADARAESTIDITSGVGARGRDEPAFREKATLPTSWLEWANNLAADTQVGVDPQSMTEWAPAWVDDAALAQAVEAVPELGTDELLVGVAGFLASDDPERPASLAAGALLERFLFAERFNPADLSALCALLEIVLRGAPPASRYKRVLGDIRSYAHQWVSTASAWKTLDIADAVALGPASDPDTRMNLVTTLLSPLNAQRRHLTAPTRRLAELIAADVGLDLDWALPESESSAEGADRPGFAPRILLYSLDTGTLARVCRTIELQWPGARVWTSSDKDGNPALRDHARNAELIVLATRRATHAATGFITENAGVAKIRYADGAGSASMIRAVEDGLQEAAR